ncbi:hypothetical protein ACIRRA_00560 [Nocardia sp. NPDC101769]|uniref:hypothetical protein n=1 Tax=Nocardia sp. NPDC101769 TaxID=3364333 RepID=UPI003818DC93
MTNPFAYIPSSDGPKSAARHDEPSTPPSLPDAGIEFENAQNGAVVVESGDGAAMIEVPQWFAQHIGADSRTLTLTPTAEDIAQLKDA